MESSIQEDFRSERLKKHNLLIIPLGEILQIVPPGLGEKKNNKQI